MITIESPRLGDPARVLNAFRAIVRAARTSTRALEMRFGTSAAQLFMLRALSGGDVGSVKELAQRTNTHNSSASVVVRRLCERGFVRRTASPDDRRRVGYAITSEGLAYLASAPRAIDDVLLEGVATMSIVEQRRMAELLTRLVIHSAIPMVDGHIRTDDDIPEQHHHAVDAAD
ncbi:MAG TPA: MarR family winged helix-turn-helix transcriptional regulator [Gemmatimonadaceae bacterium]|jgi:DNA-binding MarR family transcriptional regulator